jgi:anaerobic magnesium-protoporphyrin IX monomethyl ester cyclase
MDKRTILFFYPKNYPDRSSAIIPYCYLFLERMVRDLPVEFILVDEQTGGDFASAVQKYKDTLILGCTTAITGLQLKGGISFSQLLNQQYKIPVAWGGWHTTIYPEQVLRENFVDFIITGQGEKPFRELVLALLNNTGYKEISGLGYKEEGKTIVNPMKPFQNPFEFPPVDYSKIPVENYILNSQFSSRTIRYFASWGCPYNCGFCAQGLVFGSRWFHNDLATIEGDIEWFKKNHNVKCIKLADDNFFINPEFTRSFCRMMIEKFPGMTWFAGGHPAYLNSKYSDEDFRLIRDSGCLLIAMGTESGNVSVLEKISKKASPEDSLAIVRRATSIGKTGVNLNLMFGFPWDPVRDIHDTIKLARDAKRINPGTRALFSFYVPYPGTAVFQDAVDHGFSPYSDLDGWSMHTTKKFIAPWLPKSLYNRVRVLSDFYFNLIDPAFVRRKNSKVITYIIFILFYPIVWFRFRFNFFYFPFEAYSTLWLIKTINRIFGWKYQIKANSIDKYF